MTKRAPVCIFLTEFDKKRLERLSIKRKESKSAVIRKLINVEKYSETLAQIEINNKINAEFLYQISKMGNNLNQIAYHLNIDITSNSEAKQKLIVLFEEFKKILDEHKMQIKSKTIDLNVEHFRAPKGLKNE